jgi:hypothetical protein
LAPETTVWQYAHGVPDTTTVSPDGYSLANFYPSRPSADELQLDLFGDYKSNVALYPTFHEYFRTYRPPFLAVWGKNDPFFLPAGAEAFKPRYTGCGRRTLCGDRLLRRSASAVVMKARSSVGFEAPIS